jgi:hypothetical protein
MEAVNKRFVLINACKPTRPSKLAADMNKYSIINS